MRAMVFLRKMFSDINWTVVAVVVALSVVLGILNNLRVHDECKVKWFGGAVVSADAKEAAP